MHALTLSICDDTADQGNNDGATIAPATRSCIFCYGEILVVSPQVDLVLTIRLGLFSYASTLR